LLGGVSCDYCLFIGFNFASQVGRFWLVHTFTF
jgi:hypothetical protein